MPRFWPVVKDGELADLDKYLSVERWMRDKEDGTRYNYRRFMVRFKQTSGMDPDQFLGWAKTREDPFQITDLILKTGHDLTDSQLCQHRIAMRSFLRCNGFNNLPREKIVYTPKDWHRGYRRDELLKFYGYLDSRMHKQYVLLATETGFRVNTVLSMQYHHIKEDFEAGIVPCAVKFEPRFYKGKKSAGFTFIGQRSVDMLNESIKDHLVKKKPDSYLVPLAYTTIFEVLVRARDKAGIDPKIQPNHGLRKFYENSLDKAEIDEDMKALLKGHLAGVDVKHYSDRSWETLRPLYLKAYPYLDFQGAGPEVATEFADYQTQLEEKDKRIKQLEDIIGIKKKGDSPVSFTVQDPAVGMNILEDIRKIKAWIQKQRKTKN